MGNENFHCEIARDANTGKHRAEIYELPDRELVTTGPWAATPKAARTAAVKVLRQILRAAEGACIQ